MERFPGPLTSSSLDVNLLDSSTSINEGEELNIAMEEIWADLSRDEFDDNNDSPVSSTDVTSYFDDVTLFDDIVDTFTGSTSLLDQLPHGRHHPPAHHHHHHHPATATSFYYSSTTHNINPLASIHHQSMPNMSMLIPPPPTIEDAAAIFADFPHEKKELSDESSVSCGSTNTSPILPSRTDTATENEQHPHHAGCQHSPHSSNRSVSSVSDVDFNCYYYYNQVRNNSTSCTTSSTTASRSFHIPRASVMVPPPSPSVSSSCSSPRKRKAKAPASFPVTSGATTSASVSMGNNHSSSGRKTRKMHMMLSDLVNILKDLKKSDIRIHDLAAARHDTANQSFSHPSQLSTATSFSTSTLPPSPKASLSLSKGHHDRKKVSIAILEALFGAEPSRDIPMPQRVSMLEGQSVDLIRGS
jgi:hypothetical protein